MLCVFFLAVAARRIRARLFLCASEVEVVSRDSLAPPPPRMRACCCCWSSRCSLQSRRAVIVGRALMYHSRMLKTAKEFSNLNEFVYLAKEISRMLKEEVRGSPQLITADVRPCRCISELEALDASEDRK